MYAPAGTPKEILARLNTEVAKILALPETRQRLLQLRLRAEQRHARAARRLRGSRSGPSGAR